jgi:hypothetical protein
MAENFNLAGSKSRKFISQNSGDVIELGVSLKKKVQLFICSWYYLMKVLILLEIDGFVFLRPTESLTVFLLKIGSLRLSKEKIAMVLDFVGNF